MTYIRPGCPACEKYVAEGLAIFPPHTPSPSCESGKQPHCTCDWCF